jgi:hypothetical protein
VIGGLSDPWGKRSRDQVRTEAVQLDVDIHLPGDQVRVSMTAGIGSRGCVQHCDAATTDGARDHWPFVFAGDVVEVLVRGAVDQFDLANRSHPIVGL